MAAKFIAPSADAFRQTPAGMAHKKIVKASELSPLLTTPEDIQIFMETHRAEARYYNRSISLGYSVYALRREQGPGNVHFFIEHPPSGEQLCLDILAFKRDISPTHCCSKANGVEALKGARPSPQFLPLVNALAELSAEDSAVDVLQEEASLDRVSAQTALTLPWMPFFARQVAKIPGYRIARIDKNASFGEIRVTTTACPNVAATFKISDGKSFDASFCRHDKGGKKRSLGPNNSEIYAAFLSVEREIDECTTTVHRAGDTVVQKQSWALDVLHTIRKDLSKHAISLTVRSPTILNPNEVVLTAHQWRADGQANMALEKNEGQLSFRPPFDPPFESLVGTLYMQDWYREMVKTTRYPSPQTITSFG